MHNWQRHFLENLSYPAELIFEDEACRKTLSHTKKIIEQLLQKLKNQQPLYDKTLEYSQPLLQSQLQNLLKEITTLLAASLIKPNVLQKFSTEHAEILALCHHYEELLAFAKFHYGVAKQIGELRVAYSPIQDKEKFAKLTEASDQLRSSVQQWLQQITVTDIKTNNYFSQTSLQTAQDAMMTYIGTLSTEFSAHEKVFAVIRSATQSYFKRLADKYKNTIKTRGENTSIASEQQRKKNQQEQELAITEQMKLRPVIAPRHRANQRTPK